MNKLCLITIIICLFLVGPSCKKAEEEPMTTTGGGTEAKIDKRVKEKGKKKHQVPMIVESEEATLKIVNVSKNTVGIDLANKAPIRIVQFIIKGVEEVAVRPTSRTKGFLMKYVKENKKVIILSPSDRTIAPGTGLIAEIIYDKGGSASLSGIKIVK